MADRILVLGKDTEETRDGIDALDEDLGGVLIISCGNGKIRVVIPAALADKPSETTSNTRGEDIAACLEHIGYTEIF